MKLQMLKRALIAYVANSAKAIWSVLVHPLTITGKKNCDVADYRIYGNSVQNGEPTPENPVEVQSVGELTTRNLLDKDNVTILIESSVTTVKRIETGIALVVKNTKYENLYAFLDLGLMSDYEGQTIQATMEFSRVGSEKYTNNLFVIYDVENNTRTNLGTLKIEGNKIYLNATIGAGYTKERLTIRLYVVAGDEQATGVEYSFNNFMVYTGEEKIEYEPYHKYKVPITVRGKNYFDVNKIPSGTTTTPYKNGAKQTKRGVYNRGAKIPVSIPSGKIVKVSLDVVDSFIAGTNKSVVLSFYNGTNTLGTIWISSSIGHKKNTFTLSQESTHIQFYFMFNDTQNAPGDYVTMDNIMLKCEGDDTYEAYIEPQTVNIYLDEPLRTGQVMQKSKDNLPSLPQFKGTTVYEAQTEIPPSGIEVQYYG